MLELFRKPKVQKKALQFNKPVKKKLLPKTVCRGLYLLNNPKASALRLSLRFFTKADKNAIRKH